MDQIVYYIWKYRSKILKSILKKEDKMIDNTVQEFLRRIGAEYCVATQSVKLANGDQIPYYEFYEEGDKYPEEQFDIIDFIIKKIR